LRGHGVFCIEGEWIWKQGAQVFVGVIGHN
jgi:hypothetical protein